MVPSTRHYLVEGLTGRGPSLVEIMLPVALRSQSSKVKIAQHGTHDLPKVTGGELGQKTGTWEPSHDSRQ